MSSMRCPDCGNIINDKSGVCPRCNAIFNENTIQSDSIADGRKTTGTNKNIGLIAACVLMFVVLSVIVAFLVVPTLADRDHTHGHDSYEEVESTSVRNKSQKHTERYVARKTSGNSKSTNEAAVIGFIPVGNVGGKCDNDGGVYYYPSNMIDGDVKTCWALDIRESDNYDSGYGFGGIIFDVVCSRLEEIVVYNGYQKNDANFINNPRARHIVMYNADDMSEPIVDAQLKDVKGGQVVKAIGNSSANRNISRIIMFFPGDFYYPGKKWNDLSISEIEFWGVAR